LRRYERRDGVLTVNRLESLANYYTSYFGPAVADDAADRGDIWRRLVDGGRADGRAWDAMYLEPLDLSRPGFDALVRRPRAAGLIVQTYFCFGNWYLEVAGRSYAEYFKGLSSVVRKNVPYLARRLDKTFKVRFELVTGGAALGDAIADYERVYSSTWKKPEPYPEFVPGLARMAAKNGWLRLGLIYLDGEPAAAQIWLVVNGVASIYKICYDERFAQYSVGSVLTPKLLQHAI